MPCLVVGVYVCVCVVLVVVCVCVCADGGATPKLSPLEMKSVLEEKCKPELSPFEYAQL